MEAPDAAPSPRVKICGLRETSLVDIAIARGAHEIGLVHFAPSPRHVEVSQIAALIDHVAQRALVTVVTVDPDDALLDALIAATRPDTVQLHGRETPERVAAVRARTGVAVMKAISVGPDGPTHDIADYDGVADRLLLDAKAPKGSALPGGNGVAFDWSLLERLPALAERPFMLSGGLNARNVEAAIRIARPFGIDVSSGVETAPGLKSAELIHRFFDALDASTLHPAGKPLP